MTLSSLIFDAVAIPRGPPSCSITARPCLVVSRGPMTRFFSTVAAPGVSPHVLVHADRGDAVEPVGVIDQHPLSLGQDRFIRRMPCAPKTLGDTGHGQVLVHDAFQCPPQPTSRQLGPRLGGTASILTPYVPIADAPVTAQGHLQHGRPPPERLVRRPPDHTVTQHALTAAPTTPLLVGTNDTASQHRAVGFEPLPRDLKTTLIKPTNRAQVRASEGNVRHVKVSRMDSVSFHPRETSNPTPGTTHQPRLHPRLRRARFGHGNSRRRSGGVDRRRYRRSCPASRESRCRDSDHSRHCCGCRCWMGLQPHGSTEVS